MLYDKNEFMIFSFDKFKDVLEKYGKASKERISIFQYVQNNKGNLPHTVTFNESYQRLAYLYNMDCFNDEVFANLKLLETLRNNIIHFEVLIENEVLTSLSKLLLSCDQIFQGHIEDYGRGAHYISDELRIELAEKDLNMNRLILDNPINKQIFTLFVTHDHKFLDFDITDYYLFAEIYFENFPSEKLSRDEITKRFEMLVRHGFVEQHTYTIHYEEGGEDTISVIELSEKFEKMIVNEQEKLTK